MYIVSTFILGIIIGIISHKLTKSPSYKTCQTIGFLWKESAKISGEVEFMELTIDRLERRIERIESKLKE